MTTIRYTEDHEWLRDDDDGLATVGITDHAQDALGDIVFVELPEIGTTFSKGQPACVVESVKAAAEVKMPVGGTVVEVNADLASDPARANSDPMGDGWFIRIRPNAPEEASALLDQDAYQSLISR